MRRIITLIVLVLFVNAMKAQGVQLSWVDGFYDSDNRSEGHIVQLDSEDNVYILGVSPDADNLLDIDPSVGNVTELTSSGVFLSKFNSSGAYLWSVSLGSSGSSNTFLHGDIVFNSNGDLIMAATLIGDVDFDPSNEEMIVSAPEGMLALASYSSDGQLIFVNTFPLSVAGISGIQGIDVDSQGNIFIGGFVMNNGAPVVEIDFNSGNSDGILINEAGLTFFITKHSSSGDFTLLKTMTGTSSSSSNRLTDLAINSQDEVCITGEISGNWDMDPSEANYTLSAINRDIFIAKYSNDLDLSFAKVIVGPGAEYSREIALDAFDNIYLSGEFTGVVDFDPSDGEMILTSEINREPYIAKFSTEGNLVFALELNSDTSISSTNATRTLVADKLGYIYIAGRFDRSCDFDPSENEFILTPQNDLELYLAKYDEQGNFIWVIPYGSSSFSFNMDVAVNSQGIVTTCGLFRDNADFNPGNENSNTSGNFGNTMFIAQFEPCNYSSASTSICDGDIFQASTRTFTETGIYQVSYLSTAGCDSIVTIDLTVNELPNNAVSMDGDLAFVCAQDAAEYQWYNCETNEVISGATNQTFLPSEPGIYAVEITLNGCSINSDCMDTQIVSIDKILNSDFKIYPNPAKSSVFVQCDAGDEIGLYNLQGQLLYSQISLSGQTELNNLPKPGIYLIRISNSNSGFITQKLVVQ
jgi:hypothetical protein